MTDTHNPPVLKSFVNGITMFRVLERPAFSAAQNALFPVYFTIQTALPAVLALTYPGSRSLLGEHAGGVGGLLQESNRYSALLPIATMFVTGLVNLVVVLPRTVTVMKARYAQGKLCDGMVLPVEAALGWGGD